MSVRIRPRAPLHGRHEQQRTRRRERRKRGTTMRFLIVTLFSILVGLAASDLSAAPLAADFPPGLQVPADARPGPAFDVEKATASYLALLSPAQRERSDAYFEGGYWVGFWTLLY